MLFFILVNNYSLKYILSESIFAAFLCCGVSVFCVLYTADIDVDIVLLYACYMC
jgi:hypothetical protein